MTPSLRDKGGSPGAVEDLSAAATAARSLVEDMSHGTVIMLAIGNLIGYTYVDGARIGDNGPAVEITRMDGHDVELTTAEEVDALIECLRVVRKEIWG